MVDDQFAIPPHTQKGRVSKIVRKPRIEDELQKGLKTEQEAEVESAAMILDHRKFSLLSNRQNLSKNMYIA